jgi:hypothetical protein
VSGLRYHPTVFRPWKLRSDIATELPNASSLADNSFDGHSDLLAEFKRKKVATSSSSQPFV